MKKLLNLSLLLFTSVFSLMAAEEKISVTAVNNGYENSIIFIENGITFSVFPDGEFDFYIDNPDIIGAAYRGNNVSITFNAGFNYNPWVQYDDYGAVIQIENTPVYYDFYGRVSQIGNIEIFYNNQRLSRVGGLQVYYNNYGGFNRFSGYINVYNREYYYRPFHRYFARPAVNLCLVNYSPYRRYYYPVRYTYYKPYANNHRRAYAKIGKTYHYKGDNQRGRLYQNDRRVAARNDRLVVGKVRDRSLKYQNNRRQSPVASGRTKINSKLGTGRNVPSSKRSSYSSVREYPSRRNDLSGKAVNTRKGYSVKSNSVRQSRAAKANAGTTAVKRSNTRSSRASSYTVPQKNSSAVKRSSKVSRNSSAVKRSSSVSRNASSKKAAATRSVKQKSSARNSGNSGSKNRRGN